jgi:hypothetical protein
MKRFKLDEPSGKTRILDVRGCRSGSGIRCLFDLWIRDIVWVKKQGSEPGSGSESLETTFGVKNT